MPTTPRKAPEPGKFATPDITMAQVAAALTAIITQVVAWGWISDTQGQQLVSIAGLVLPPALVIADAVIRHGRATGSANK